MLLKGHSHEKVVEIIPLNDRFGRKKGMQTLFKFLKSLFKKQRFLKRGDSRCKINFSDCKILQVCGGKFLSVLKF
jgi:hypothetical protein